jgi:hypothetical protein
MSWLVSISLLCAEPYEKKLVQNIWRECNRTDSRHHSSQEHKNVRCSGLFEETVTSYLHFRVDKQKRPFKKGATMLNEVRRFTLRPVCALKAPCPAQLSFQQRNVTPFNKTRLRVSWMHEIVSVAG